MNNWSETLLSQYADSPNLVAFLGAMNSAIDPSVDLQNFYANVFDITTAVGTGLDIWGRIVGITRYLQIPSSPAYFGFKEAYVSGAAANPQPFGQAPFYVSSASSSTYTLSDPAFRTLILAKAAANISSCTAASINAILDFLFGTQPTTGSILGSSTLPFTLAAPSGVLYVNDLNNNTYQIVSTTHLGAVALAIINSGVLPRPAGASFTVIEP